LSWNYGFPSKPAYIPPDDSVVEYYERMVSVTGNELPLADFVASQLHRLSEVDLVALDSLLRGDETVVQGLTVRRIK
jgi:hypothetical protein